MQQFADEGVVWEELAPHPAVVELLDNAVEEGVRLLVLEYCDGGSLFDLINGRYTDGLPADLVADVLSDLCAAIGHVHRHGYVYRTATIESSNGKLRDELLNVEVSSMLKEAQMPTGGGSTTACIRAAH